MADYEVVNPTGVTPGPLAKIHCVDCDEDLVIFPTNVVLRPKPSLSKLGCILKGHRMIVTVG